MQHTLNSPLFGWGTHGRNWPIDPETGRQTARAVDALWLINFSIYGFFGLLSFLAAMMLGPWKVLRSMAKKRESVAESAVIPTILSLVVILFMIDTIINAMISPVYILCSGVVVSCFLAQKKERTPKGPSFGVKPISGGP